MMSSNPRNNRVAPVPQVRPPRGQVSDGISRGRAMAAAIIGDTSRRAGRAHARRIPESGARPIPAEGTSRRRDIIRPTIPEMGLPGVRLARHRISPAPLPQRIDSVGSNASAVDEAEDMVRTLSLRSITSEDFSSLNDSIGKSGMALPPLPESAKKTSKYVIQVDSVAEKDTSDNAEEKSSEWDNPRGAKSTV